MEALPNEKTSLPSLQRSNEVVSGIESDGQLEWTEEEEKALVRKVDFLLMPLLILGFFALQLDRGNIGNALTDFFLNDVGITQNQFNFGQQLLALGIILLEIPSNIVLYRVGPTLWIGGQIVAWGLVATFQAFQKGLGPYLATRLLLGLHMRGIAGLAGWQWLFILEGVFTILIGIAFILAVPFSTAKPVSVLGFRYFTESESRILTERVLRDDPSKAQLGRNVSWKELKAVVGNWSLLESDDKIRRFIILSASVAVSWPWHPVNGAWLALNAQSAGERSITMAIHIMAANCSGLVGKQIFRSEDAPVYRRAWTEIVGLTSAAVFISLLANLQYYFGNGRKLHRTGLKYHY
ncbi:hypothetical protein SAPIO_CDS7896 [Scedosporium apiospermum]|uniref:Alternative sulfate transporter n=1 Tax=Pseudallescheria apiosperma TaxID=563466 RepID=A0A084G0N5_PSEDA|nr:uncharacterized protein SAPIO_CDS7896 [Scedosporium apiospermum]KEZ40897.1 hypothetical protein SAPIO_CDS7896 [Scedosporium apiospermum]